MMGRALLILGWLGTAGFVGSGVIGYWIDETPEWLGIHLLLGLVSILLVLFSHSWIMFYLIGTGKAIKTAVAEHSLDPDYAERTKEFKNRSYPWLMGATGLTMATFILGGGVATGAVPAWLHHGLFLAATAAQVRSILLETSVLVANERLMGELNQRIGASA